MKFLIAQTKDDLMVSTCENYGSLMGVVMDTHVLKLLIIKRQTKIFR